MSDSSPSQSPDAPPFAPHREFVFTHADRQERMVVAAVAGNAPELAATADRWLSSVEQQRVARAVEKRRHEFMLGRYAAKSALAVLNRRDSLAFFTIVPGAFDQPVVLGEGTADVTLAHTAGAAVAVAHERGHPMGIDLEVIDPARIDVLRTQIAASELPAPNGPLAGEPERLFVLWSAKEALSKALRCGLTCPFELLAAAEARSDETGVCTGTYANFGQYQFVAWLAGPRACALACSRNARLEPVVGTLVRFTRETLGGPP